MYQLLDMENPWVLGGGGGGGGSGGANAAASGGGGDGLGVAALNGEIN